MRGVAVYRSACPGNHILAPFAPTAPVNATPCTVCAEAISPDHASMFYRTFVCYICSFSVCGILAAYGRARYDRITRRLPRAGS